MRRYPHGAATGVLLVLAGGGAVASRPENVAAQQRQAPPVPPLLKPLVIEDVTVIDVQQGRSVAHQTIVVVGNRIQAVGKAGEVKVPPPARRVSGRGKYLIPGLWDMHTHVFMNCNQDVAYPLLLANGVTGIRELNVPMLTEALQARHDVAAGTRVGPRAIFSGPVVDGQVSVGWCRREPVTVAVTTPDEARRVVDSLKAAGADVIKVREGLSRELHFAVAAESRRIGIPLVGHIPHDRSIGAVEASDSGWRSIEHVPRSLPLCEDEPTCTTMAQTFARNGTMVTPTLLVMAWLDGVVTVPEAYKHDLSRYAHSKEEGADVSSPPASGAGDSVMWLTYRDGGEDSDWAVEQRLTRLLYQVGVPLLAGTDMSADGMASFGLREELRLMVEGAGMTPLDALRTATVNPVTFLHAADSLGAVAAGKLADIVLLNADPLTAIENAAAIEGVVADGRFYDRPALDALRAAAARAAARARGEP